MLHIVSIRNLKNAQSIHLSSKPTTSTNVISFVIDFFILLRQKSRLSPQNEPYENNWMLEVQRCVFNIIF